MNEVIKVQGGVPVKCWTKGLEIEASARQQLINISKMPFIYSHIAVMPDVHMGKGATVGSVIPTLKAIIPAAVGVDIGCFRGDTKVPLLDGSQKTLKELTDRGESFWVYSIGPTGAIAPGKARACLTRKNASLMKVVVSGGEEIICTPDHQFMLIDGSYKEAQYLKYKDSLMPFYRRYQSKDGYESVSTGKRDSQQTHHLVWEYFNGARIPGADIHHLDHKIYNNTPENLGILSAEDHGSLHRAIDGITFPNHDPSFQEKRQAGLKRRKENPESRAKMQAVGVKNITTYMTERPEHYKEATKNNGKRGAQYLEKINKTERKCSDCDLVLKNPSSIRWHKKKIHNYNHKVLYTESLSHTEAVYCLQVEEHHNFALSAGVFVHNCGMAAVKTTLTRDQLPDNLAPLRAALEEVVPVGMAYFDDQKLDHSHPATHANRRAWKRLQGGYERLSQLYPKLDDGQARPRLQLGTLGGGNHFIEVLYDELDGIWLMLHSGSRGIGNRIGTMFIELARRDMETLFINLPDKDLAYLAEGTKNFDEYVQAVGWAQEYASYNRAVMMESVIAIMNKFFPGALTVDKLVISCHHNYISQETHFGEKVWLTRKGAVSAAPGELGIIPGSMGTGSYIVKGKGNPDSFNSCSHGAGRTMSRGKAKERITLEDHIEATKGIECRKDHGVIDESPAAYKDLGTVMAAQDDLVDIEFRLLPLLCIKG